MNKEDRTAAFKAKNEARKQCRGSSHYTEGRTQRRLWANDGAFGKLDNIHYNKCVLGTTGEAKDGKSE